MAHSGHVIDTAVFDVSFDWPDDDVDRSAALVDLVRGRLLVVAEEVFDELGPPDAVATIESLEIDLGVVARDEVSEELPRRFRARLREALEGRIKPFAGEPGETARVVPARQAELEDLQHFLRTGRLPWSVAVGAAAFDEMAERVAGLDGARVVGFLRGSTDDAALQRALQQLPEAALRQLLAALDPRGSDRLVRLYEQVGRVLDQAPLDWRARDDLELGFWRALLIPLLRQPSAAQLEGLAATALDALAVPAAAIRAQLAEAVGLALAAGAPAGVPSASDAAAAENAAAPAHTPGRGPEAEPEAERAKSPGRRPRRSREEERDEEYEARLAEALVSGAVARLRGLWPELLAEHRDLVRRVAARHLRREGVRHAVAQGFPPAMYMDLVRLLDPAAAEYVADLLERARVFAAGKREWAGVKARLREHTLAHLVEQRGEFEPGSYLAGLIRRVAEEEGAGEDETRAAIAEKLRRSGSADPFRAEMLALVSAAEEAARARHVGEEAWVGFEARLDAALSRRDSSAVADLWEALAAGSPAPPAGPGAKPGEPDLIRRAAWRIVGSDAARRILADSFPTATFLDVVRALDAGASAFVAELLRHADAFAVGGVASEAEARIRLREHVLTYLAARGAAFDAFSFLASLVGRIVEAEGTSAEIVRASVAAALRLAPAAGAGPAVDAFREELRARLEDPGPRRLEAPAAEAMAGAAESGAEEPAAGAVAAPEPSGEAPIARRRGAPRPDARQSEEEGEDGEDEYEARLAEALLSGAGSRLRELWPALLAERPELVRRVVTRYTRRADVRRAVAERFPSAMFLDVVRILDLAASLYVGELLERGRTFAGGGKSWAGVRARLREHTLAYLVEHEGGPFERRPYLASLIARLEQSGDAAADDTRTTLAALRRSAEMMALIAEVEPSAPGLGDPADADTRRLDAALATGDAAGLGGSWTALLRDRPELIERAVLRHVEREDARRAIAAGFPPDMFIDVVRVLDPDAAVWVAELLRRPEAFALRGAAGAGDVAAARLREHTLAVLVEARDAPFDPSAFLSALIGRLAAAEGTGAEDARASIVAALRAAGAASEAGAVPGAGERDAFADTLARLIAPAERGDATEDAEVGEPWATRQALLRAALESGDAGRFGELWPSLAHERPELAERTVARWASREDVRRAAVELFPVEMFVDALRVLAPSAGPYLAAVLSRAEAFAFGESAAHAALRLREHAIAYVMARRGGAFEPRAYVASLITARAEETGTGSERVRATIAAALRAPAPSGAPGLDTSVAELVARLAEGSLGAARGTAMPAAEATRFPLDRVAAGSPAKPGEPERARRPGVGRRQASALLRAYDLMEVVRAAVWGQLPSFRSEGVGAAIEELTRAHPRRLVALVLEMRASGITAPMLAVHLSPAELRRMVDAWLHVAAERGPKPRGAPLHAAPSPDPVSDLRAAILSFAARALHSHRYFAGVLDRLAAGSLLDFEDILLEAASEEEAARGAGAAQSAAAADGVPMPEAAQAPAPGTVTLDDFDRYLGEGVVTARSTPPRLVALVESLLPEQVDRLAQWLAPRLELRAARERLAGLLPENALARIADALWPGDWARAQAFVDLVDDVSFLEDGPRVPRQSTWRFTLDHLAGRSAPFEDAAFARRLLDELSVRLEWADRGDLETRMRARLADEAPSYLAPSEDATDVLPPEPVQEILLSDEEPEGETRIENAGLVLATPYLPRLFSMLEFLAEDGKAFKDSQSAARAAQLTQFVVTGREDTPEFLLFLNRILCGIPANQPLPRRFEPSDPERNAVDGLLRAMIQHWGALGNTSIAGLRESFLQRGGSLALGEDVWSLRVEEKAFDVLLDRVPWTFKTIRFPWMRTVVQVEWR